MVDAMTVVATIAVDVTTVMVAMTVADAVAMAVTSLDS
jgi:hypothetical protein